MHFFQVLRLKVGPDAGALTRLTLNLDGDQWSHATKGLDPKFALKNHAELFYVNAPAVPSFPAKADLSSSASDLVVRAGPTATNGPPADARPALFHPQDRTTATACLEPSFPAKEHRYQTKIGLDGNLWQSLNQSHGGDFQWMKVEQKTIEEEKREEDHVVEVPPISEEGSV